MKQKLAWKHYERGRQFELQERLSEAAECYRQACALEPDFPEPFFALGRMEATRGRHMAALNRLDEGLKRSPDDLQMLEWRAYVFGRLRRYDEALADYRRVSESGDPQTRVNLGRMLLALGRFDEAEETLKTGCDESAAPLLKALPRYREYERADRTDDQRGIHYLFGGTVVLGTLGDGGMALGDTRYLLLTSRHIALTLRRFESLRSRARLRFDGVAGDGPHHRPVALVVSRRLGLPFLTSPKPGARVLLCSAVVKQDELKALSAPWRAAGPCLHFALGFVPDGDPSEDEPEVVGHVGRSAVGWYRVERYARDILSMDGDFIFDPNGDGAFEVGPAYIDPNTERVAGDLFVAMERQDLEQELDPFLGQVLAYYLDRHRRCRAFILAEPREGVREL